MSDETKSNDLEVDAVSPETVPPAEVASVVDTAVESKADQQQDADSEPVLKPVSEPVAEPKAEPIEVSKPAIKEPEPETVKELKPEPGKEAAKEPVKEAAKEPVKELDLVALPERVKDVDAKPPKTKPPVPPKSESEKAKQRRANVIVGIILILAGLVLIATIYLFTPEPEQKIPYLLDPVEKHLDANMRYKTATSLEGKDWRHDFVVEQSIWTAEISKIMLGRPEAKPLERKRDFLLFLADSYYKDEPHFSEAKAAYLAANACPRIPHENSYDYADAELWRRIAYCDIRLGFYDEAVSWLKKAQEAVEAGGTYKNDVGQVGLRNKIVDQMAEAYSRKGEPKKAEALIKMRLGEIKLTDPNNCIESPILFQVALAKEQEGDLQSADKFYKKAIERSIIEENRAAIKPESLQDNSRPLARMLMTYSHLLRKLHRNPEAIATMRRALIIYDNPPV